MTSKCDHNRTTWRFQSWDEGGKWRCMACGEVIPEDPNPTPEQELAAHMGRQFGALREKIVLDALAGGTP